jgi:hypothetical protein
MTKILKKLTASSVVAVSSSIKGVEQFGHQEDESETNGSTNEKTTKVQLERGCSSVLSSSGTVCALNNGISFLFANLATSHTLTG